MPNPSRAVTRGYGRLTPGLVAGTHDDLAGFDTEDLLTEQLIAILPAGHPLATRTSPTMADPPAGRVGVHLTQSHEQRVGIPPTSVSAAAAVGSVRGVGWRMCVQAVSHSAQCFDPGVAEFSA